MSTTKETRRILHAWIAALFATPPAEFDVPIESSSIKRYLTMPPELSNDPNWMSVATVHSLTDAMVVGGDEDLAVFHIMLVSRIDQTDIEADAEASRELAEDWIDDAEQMIVEAVSKAHKSNDSDDWQDIYISSLPVRDRDGRYFKQYRTSQFTVTIERN